MDYKMVKCIYYNRSIGNINGWQISCDYQMFWINLWMHKLTPTTARNYGYKVCLFLNWCKQRNKTYLKATNADLNNFVLYIQFDNKNGIFEIGESASRHSTVKNYINAITNMYTFILSYNLGNMIMIDEEKKINKNSYLKDILWSPERKKVFINKNIEKYKAKRIYEKWYSAEQVDAILSNFNTIRNAAIFALTLEGMRIDEVLSIRMIDYNPKNCTVTAFRSKRKITGDTHRIVVLSERTIRLLEDYLNFERSPSEMKMLDNNIIDTGYMFINLKYCKTFGQAVEYANYRYILRRAANSAGIPEELVRTHSGRSTAVMNDILFHSKHPDLLSIEDIRIKYGWSNISSIMPYLDSSNPLVALENRKRLDRINEEVINVFGKIKATNNSKE